MKLPHITVEYREEESYALGKLSASLVLGFSIHWAWVYLVMFNGADFFFPQAVDMQSIVFLVSLVTFGCTLLCYGLFLKQARALFATARERRRNRLIAAASVFVGMLVMAFVSSDSAIGAVAAWVAGIGTGFGSAVLLMSYGVSFSVCDLPEVVVCTAVSLVLAVLIFTGVCTVEELAHPVGALLCLAAPAVEYLCLGRCSSQLVDELQFMSITLSVSIRTLALHVCLPSIAFGLLLGIIRTQTLVKDGSIFSETLFSFVGSGVLVCLLILGAMLTQRQKNNFMFRTLLPVFALFMLMDAAFDQQYSPTSIFLLFGGYMILEASMWVMYADISQRFRISAFLVFGFGRGSLALGSIVGYVLTLPTSPIAFLFDNTALFTTFVLAVVMLGWALLPTNAEIRQALKRGSNCPALVGEDDYDLLWVSDALALGTPGRVEVLHRGDSFQVEREGAACGEGFANETGEADDAKAHADEGVREKAFGDAESEAAQAIQVSESQAPMKKPADADGEDAPAKGRFKMKCAVISERYLLSRKETEILFLLAKGRNAAAIQEKLYISAGTANTHMRHIYRKLDVHSQQELMDLVDSADISDYRS